MLQASSLPIAFARGSGALEHLVTDRDVRVVLYLNQIEANFRMLRSPSPVHIQIGHGESDKGGSVSNQHKAYDLTSLAETPVVIASTRCADSMQPSAR